jgi:hypothetical protein
MPNMATDSSARTHLRRCILTLAKIADFTRSNGLVGRLGCSAASMAYPSFPG